MILDNEVQLLTEILPGVHFTALGIGIIGQNLLLSIYYVVYLKNPL